MDRQSETAGVRAADPDVKSEISDDRASSQSRQHSGPKGSQLLGPTAGSVAGTSVSGGVLGALSSVSRRI